jgi:acetyl esterase
MGIDPSNAISKDDAMQEALSEKYRLEPEMAAYLAEGAQAPALPRREIDIASFRAWYEEMALASAAPRAAGITVNDASVSGAAGPVETRWYRPREPVSRACLVYFHGGGWVLGNLDTHDDICADLAAASGTTIVAVDYRLSPEHRFPAALDDAWAAFETIVANAAGYDVDPGNIMVGGDSAGGNLAAAVCLLGRDRGGPRPAGQLLIYPGLSDRLSLPSHHDNADAPILTVEDMEFFWRAYLGDIGDTVSPYAAPLSAPDLSNLPPAMILTMEFDPLRDDGRYYANRLREAGCEVQLHDSPGLVHGCIRARHCSPGAGRMFAAASRWVNQPPNSSGPSGTKSA